MPIKYNKLAMQPIYDRLAVLPTTHRIKQISEPTALRWYDIENQNVVNDVKEEQEEKVFKSDILKKK